MRKRRLAFTLIELLVVISIIALLIGILLPALAAARKTARQMQNNTQLRGIQQAMVMFGQSNKTWYPGVVGSTQKVVDGTDLDPQNENGDSIRSRFQILLVGDFFQGEYVISPSETKYVWTTGAVTTYNLSYALLQIHANANLTLDSDRDDRNGEWRETINTQALVISDRNTGDNTGDMISSIHAEEDGGDWRGSATYNDNHTKFETSHVIRTQYGSAPEVEEDHIFLGNDGSNASEPDDGNALMIHDGT